MSPGKCILPTWGRWTGSPGTSRRCQTCTPRPRRSGRGSPAPSRTPRHNKVITTQPQLGSLSSLSSPSLGGCRCRPPGTARSRVCRHPPPRGCRRGWRPPGWGTQRKTCSDVCQCVSHCLCLLITGANASQLSHNLYAFHVYGCYHSLQLKCNIAKKCFFVFLLSRHFTGAAAAKTWQKADRPPERPDRANSRKKNSTWLLLSESVLTL